MGKSLAVFLTAACAGVLVEEVKSLLPWLSTRALRVAVRLLPSDAKERYAEEWASHLLEVPSPISKLIFALYLMPTGLKTRYDFWRDSRYIARSSRPYSGMYRLALLMLVAMVIRYRLRKAMEWLGFSRPRAKILGIDSEVFTAVILGVIVYFCGVQKQLPGE